MQSPVGYAATTSAPVGWILALVGLALLLFVAERRWALRAPVAELAARLLLNLALAAGALLVAGALVRPLLDPLLGGRGLLGRVPGPPIVRGALAFLLLDLSFYWWHRANHRVPLLWRFHNVHHLDPDLDVSTALRFHFGEVALSAAFRIAQVALLGLRPLEYWVYEICFQANTLAHHSNVRLPIALERALARVLVTPRMHGIHHSQLEAEASSNYGVVLPIWDRLHRTLRLNVPQRLIRIGVPAYTTRDDNRLLACVLHPFRRQRDYWRGGETEVIPERDALPEPRTRLAE